jgi:hypothetical protein
MRLVLLYPGQFRWTYTTKHRHWDEQWYPCCGAPGPGDGWEAFCNWCGGTMHWDCDARPGVPAWICPDCAHGDD